MSANTLTERYVHEVVRRIPADQRDDVADELRAAIADTVEAREAQEPASAEREVLTEMGDPIRLAARYTGRPLSLVGPEYYPSYVRLLKILLSAVLPVVAAASVVADVLDGGDIVSVLAGGIGAVITVGTQMFAWLTIVFVLVERSRTLERSVHGPDAWTPDDLPDLPRPGRQDAAAYASAAWNTLLLALIVWQHVAEPYRTDRGGIPVLDPALWSGWIWPILAGLAGVVTFELVRAAVHRWTVPLAAGCAVAEALFALPLAWVLYQHMFFNPEFLAAVNDGWTVPDSFYTIAMLGVLAVSAIDAVKRFREALD
ncbi:permease prefix domain 1-containing protein [Actinocorallia sp. B10E7]|uniref:HAAS signaling domain-containing protein n=1 Tax=Actinocorallia sp. B10E7 TaxID=3153558 RepID=UPI00325C89AD